MTVLYSTQNVVLRFRYTLIRIYFSLSRNARSPFRLFVAGIDYIILILEMRTNVKKDNCSHFLTRLLCKRKRNSSFYCLLLAKRIPFAVRKEKARVTLPFASCHILIRLLLILTSNCFMENISFRLQFRYFALRRQRKQRFYSSTSR